MGGVIKLWNTTLLCTKVYNSVNERNFKEGQTYEVCNGKLIDGNGDKSYGTYKNISEIKESFYADFEEVKR